MQELTKPPLSNNSNFDNYFHEFTPSETFTCGTLLYTAYQLSCKRP